MYYIRVWYKDPKGKISHEDREYHEPMEIMKCIPYRAEIIDDSSIIYQDKEKLYPKYNKKIDRLEEEYQKMKEELHNFISTHRKNNA